MRRRRQSSALRISSTFPSPSSLNLSTPAGDGPCDSGGPRCLLVVGVAHVPGPCVGGAHRVRAFVRKWNAESRRDKAAKSPSRLQSAGPARAKARAGPSPNLPSVTVASTATTTSSSSTAHRATVACIAVGDSRGMRARRVRTVGEPARGRQRGQVGGGLSAVTRDHRRADVHARDGDREQHGDHRHRHQACRPAISARRAPPRPPPARRP